MSEPETRPTPIWGTHFAQAVLFPSPALGERSHRSLARRLIAVRGALDVPTVAARPHPWAALRRSRLQMEDAADDLAVFEHVVVVLAPTRGVAALEEWDTRATPPS